MFLKFYPKIHHNLPELLISETSNHLHRHDMF